MKSINIDGGSIPVLYIFDFPKRLNGLTGRKILNLLYAGDNL